ncbi:hypothetical protein [Vibrio parahaemolyticus]|uniref:hypothetical protein n=1 Tax=Vibrio parahaemolyticus TaxID=670 RepID=UPI0004071377|nr:hypothetical protein [Vibrio parahaemolyticus]
MREWLNDFKILCIGKWYDARGRVKYFSDNLINWSMLHTISSMGITNIATLSTLTIPVIAGVVITIQDKTSSNISIPDSMAWFYLAGFLCVIAKTFVLLFCPVVIRQNGSEFEYLCHRIDLDIKTKELAENNISNEKTTQGLLLDSVKLPMPDIHYYRDEWEKFDRKFTIVRWVITALYSVSILMLIIFYGYKYPSDVYHAADLDTIQLSSCSSVSSSTNTSTNP